jgi:hypothetical protein
MKPTNQKGAIMKKLLSLSVLMSFVLFVSCTQQSPSGGNSMSAEDRARMDGLKEEVNHLSETNKALVAKLEKQSAALETVKMLADTYDKRIGKVEDQALWQSNSLNNVVQYFADQLAKQQFSISNLAWQTFMLNLKSDNTEAVFDAADSTGFSRLYSSSGFFLVSLKNVEQYLDGYKATFDVGNPLSATYENLKYQVTWGKKFDAKSVATNTNAFSDWETSLHSKEISSADKLLPGSWNKISLILSPAKSDELSYIKLKIETSTASLRTPTVNP